MQTLMLDRFSAFWLRSKCSIIVGDSYALAYCSELLPESSNRLGGVRREGLSGLLLSLLQRCGVERQPLFLYAG